MAYRIELSITSVLESQAQLCAQNFLSQKRLHICTFVSNFSGILLVFIIAGVILLAKGGVNACIITAMITFLAL